MSGEKTLILLRHGETNYPDCYIGSRDVSLSDAGINQVALLQKRMQEHKIDRIISSPMQRCRQTCEILFPDFDISCDNDLREIDFGRWEGLNFQEITEQDPELVKQWANWSPDFQFPVGESIGHFISRVQVAATRLNELKEENILVSSHGGVVRALLCHYLGIEPRNYLLFQIEKGKFSTLDVYDGLGVLTGLNLS